MHGVACLQPQGKPMAGELPISKYNDLFTITIRPLQFFVSPSVGDLPLPGRIHTRSADLQHVRREHPWRLYLSLRNAAYL